MLILGFLVTYWAPLTIVLCLSLSKEIYDEIKRWMKDRKYNSEKFT